MDVNGISGGVNVSEMIVVESSSQYMPVTSGSPGGDRIDNDRDRERCEPMDMRPPMYTELPPQYMVRGYAQPVDLDAVADKDKTKDKKDAAAKDDKGGGMGGLMGILSKIADPLGLFGGMNMADPLGLLGGMLGGGGKGADKGGAPGGGPADPSAAASGDAGVNNMVKDQGQMGNLLGGIASNSGSLASIASLI